MGELMETTTLSTGEILLSTKESLIVDIILSTIRNRATSLMDTISNPYAMGYLDALIELQNVLLLRGKSRGPGLAWQNSPVSLSADLMIDANNPCTNMQEAVNLGFFLQYTETLIAKQSARTLFLTRSFVWPCTVQEVDPAEVWREVEEARRNA